MSSGIHAGLLLVVIVLIGLVDVATGPDLGFSLFYLLPILYAGWQLSMRSALVMAALAATSWMAAELAWRALNLVSVWNGFTRLAIFVMVAFLAARVRTDERQLRALNERLEALLHEEQLAARTDHLTGLPNRRLCLDELRRIIARSRRAGTQLAVGYIDLDGFKALNDRHGHLAGDAVLKRCAEVLKARVREGHIVARLGGDEFALLLEGASEASAKAVCSRVQDELLEAFTVMRHHDLGVSLGVACFDVPPGTPEEVLDHADAAMYCAKAKGGSQLYVTHLTSS